MHNPDYVPQNTTTLTGAHIALPSASIDVSSFSQLSVLFSTQQTAPVERRLSKLIAEKIEEKKFFYGIEITAHSVGQPLVLDYNSFGALLPLFTSLIWLGPAYSDIERLTDVPAIRFAQQLQPLTVVMPHFTCYHATEQRLTELLAQNFSNILALRGDQVDDKQEFKHAADLVTKIRKARGDTISIGVAGYPEGHPNALSLDEDMEFLIQKVRAGADFIITQLCFETVSIIDFLKNCHSHGLRVPIIIGVYIPENFYLLKRMCTITGVLMPKQDFAKYKELRNNTTAFQKHAVDKAVQMITEVLSSDLGVYGIQFYSMNKFKAIQLALAEIAAKNYTFENKVQN